MRIPHSAVNLTANRGRLVRVKETLVFYAVARQEREKEKCEANRCIEIVRVQVAESSDNLIFPAHTLYTINGSSQPHEAESEPETARSDAPSPPPCRSARNRFSTRGTTRRDVF